MWTWRRSGGAARRTRLLLVAVAIGAGACAEADPPASTPDPSSTDVSPAPATATDGWSEGELALLESLSLGALSDPPPSPSNRFADDVRAARLGQRLFFDPALSRDGTVSCASCHVPERHFSDGAATATGLGRGTRNTPGIVGAAWSPWQFWDGRRDSLWAQALAPLESAHEMGSTRMEVARLVAGAPRYRDDYVALFGPAPRFDDPERYPERAGPFAGPEGRAAWRAMDPEARAEVNRAFVHAGKAIAAWERRLRPAASRFDRYVAALRAGDVAGARDVLDADERAGLRLFVDAGRTQCLRCHNGPLLTNQSFHDVGASPRGGPPDLGRYLGIQSLLFDEFNCLGPWSDAAADDCGGLRFLDRREAGRLTGAFKTPGLRDVAETAPYFHDGRFATLAEVIDHYRDPPDEPSSELTPLELSDAEAAQLEAFLHTLTGGVDAGPGWLRPPSPAPPRAGEHTSAPSG